MSESLSELHWPVCFVAPVCAWVVAQGTKMLVGFHRTHRLDFKYLVSTGGMPSAHSSLVAGTATALGLVAGFRTPLFALGFVFSLIVMFDASTVRRAAGQQARLLNEIIEEFFTEHHFSERKLAELLGHTRFEVFMGALMGVLVALMVWSLALT